MSVAGPRGGGPTAVIADDHQAMRLGVRMALMRGGFDVVAEAADCDGAVDATVREQPDVCLLDIRMPGGGIEAAAAISARAPSTAVVMLTVSNDTDDVLASLRAGAVGYLPKDTRPDRLPAALCGVLKGEAALPRALVGRVLSEFRDVEAPAAYPIRVGDVELTRRESEILRMLNSGMTTVEVGKLLSLSPITIRRHVSAAVARLGVADRAAALQAI
ncbi:MAG TPA: response regulator transcription factor [Solirubrobacteraceae bacterium]|nr:response regulator transcription factor [Solirubrobacteraceae bacterium]